MGQTLSLVIKFTWLVVVIDLDHSRFLSCNLKLLYERNSVRDDFVLLHLLAEQQNTKPLTPKTPELQIWCPGGFF